ncbi:hydantoinase/carbamoylase family amidase [Povalibacter sp.]|uniref:hydantoinase/carbamoylase family amidase n=1 Tax=Povalibacter sp. TaxID=1962978 RepID=UPI002F42FC2B
MTANGGLNAQRITITPTRVAAGQAGGKIDEDNQPPDISAASRRYGRDPSGPIVGEAGRHSNAADQCGATAEFARAAQRIRTPGGRHLRRWRQSPGLFRRRYRCTGLRHATDARCRIAPVSDAAGNISGLRAGTDPSRRPITLGSHIDSVPDGGNFDGQLGSMATIEVLHTLNEKHIATRHPIEVVIWSNEEGDPMGSAAAIGSVPPMLADPASMEGVAAREGLRRIGGDPERIASARRAPGSIHCYLELHIEQGGILAREGIPIGVVDGIVGIAQYQVTIEGVANHAGTTPMPMRQDALLAAAKMVEAVNEIAKAEPGSQVATVGKLEVTPNAANVIPGRVRHTVEIRDLSSGKVARLGAAIAKRAEAIATATRTRITMTK